MRKKEERLIVAFFSTHDAMAFEEYCLQCGAEGRLIPLPREISAGCGLAWSSPPEAEADVRKYLENTGIQAQHLKLLMV